MRELNLGRLELYIRGWASYTRGLGWLPNKEEVMARVSLSRKQEFELNTLITRVCSEVDGYAVYQEGWDDNKVLEEFNKTVTPEIDKATGKPKIYNLVHVSGARSAVVGNLRQVRVKSSDMMEAKISELRGRIEILEGMIADLFDVRFKVGGDAKTLAQLVVDNGGKSDMGKLKDFRELGLLKTSLTGAGGAAGTENSQSAGGASGAGSGGRSTGNKPISRPPG